MDDYVPTTVHEIKEFGNNVKCICGVVYNYPDESLFCPRCKNGIITRIN